MIVGILKELAHAISFQKRIYSVSVNDPLAIQVQVTNKRVLRNGFMAKMATWELFASASRLNNLDEKAPNLRLLWY